MEMTIVCQLIGFSMRCLGADQPLMRPSAAWRARQAWRQPPKAGHHGRPGIHPGSASRPSVLDLRLHGPGGRRPVLLFQEEADVAMRDVKSRAFRIVDVSGNDAD